MGTITLRVQDSEKNTINSYAKMHGLSVSEFARQAMLERIEDELDLSELNEAIAEWKKNPVTYTSEEVWRMLDVE